MEIDDRLASQIHGIISSDSDSDLEGKREFDELYNSLKPPPYDYNLIRDRIVVISQRKVANAWEKRLEITQNIKEVKIEAASNGATPKRKKKKSESKTEDQKGLIKTKNDNEKKSPSKNTTEKETLDIFSVLSNNRKSGKKKIMPLDIEFLDDYKEYVEHNSINISEEKCINPWKELGVQENDDLSDSDYDCGDIDYDWDKNWNYYFNKNPKYTFGYFSDDGEENFEKNAPKKAEEKSKELQKVLQKNMHISENEHKSLKRPESPLSYLGSKSVWGNASRNVNLSETCIDTNKTASEEQSPTLYSHFATKEIITTVSADKDVTKKKKKFQPLNILLDDGSIVEVEKRTKTKKLKAKTTEATEVSEKTRKLEYIDVSDASIPALTPKKKKKKTKKKKSKQSVENPSNNTQDTTGEQEDRECKEILEETVAIIDSQENSNQTVLHEEIDNDIQPTINLSSTNEDLDERKKKFRSFVIDTLLTGRSMVEVEKTTDGKATETEEVLEKTLKLEYIDVSDASIPALTPKKKKKKTKKKKSKQSVENPSNNTQDTTGEQEDRECKEILEETVAIIDSQENSNQTVLHEEIDNDIQPTINLSSTNEDLDERKKKFRSFVIDTLLTGRSMVEVEKTTDGKATETEEVLEKTLKLEYIDVSDASIPALTPKKKKKKTKKKKSKQSVENSSNDTKDTTGEQEYRECKEILEETVAIIDSQENPNETVLHEEIDNNIQPTINLSSTNEDLDERKKKFRSFVIDTLLNDRSMVEVEKTTEGKDIKGKTTETEEVLEKTYKLEYNDISEASIHTPAVKTKKKKKSSDIGDNIKETTEAQEECKEVLGEIVTVINNLNQSVVDEEIKKDIIDNTIQQSNNLSLVSLHSEDVVEWSTMLRTKNKKSKNITTECVTQSPMIELLNKIDGYEKKFVLDTDSLQSILGDTMNMKMPATPIAEAKTKKKRKKKPEMTITKELPRSESVDIVDHNIISRTEESDQDTKQVIENYEKHFVEQSDNAQEIIDCRENINEAKITEVDNNSSIETDSKTSLNNSGKKRIVFIEKFGNFIHNPYSASSSITLNLTLFNYEQLYRGLIVFIQKSNEKYHALIPSKIFLKYNIIGDYFVEHTHTFMEICSKSSVNTKKGLRKPQKRFSSELYEYNIDTIEKKNRLYKQICMFLRQNFVEISKIWLIQQNNNKFFDKIIEAVRPKEKISTSIRSDLATIFDNGKLTLEKFDAGVVPKIVTKFNYEQYNRYKTFTFKKRNLCIDNRQLNTIVPTNYLNQNPLIRFEAKIDEISSIRWQIDSRLYPNISIISDIIDALTQRRNNSRKETTRNIKNKDDAITTDLSGASLNIIKKETIQKNFPSLKEVNENKFTRNHKIHWLVRNDNLNKKKKKRFVPFSQYNPKLVEENSIKTTIEEAKDSVKIQESRINISSHRYIFNKKIEAVNTKIQPLDPPIETNTTNFKNIMERYEKKSKQSTIHQPSTGVLDKLSQNVPLGCIKKTDAAKVQIRKKSRDMVTIPDENRENIEVMKPKSVKTSSSADLGVDIATVYKENFKTPQNFTKSFGDFKKFFTDSSAVLQDCKRISEVISGQIGNPRTYNESSTKDLEKMVRKLIKINTRATAVISHCEEMCGLIGEGIRKNENICNDNHETISLEKCKRPRSHLGNLSVNPKPRAQMTINDFAFPPKQRIGKNQDDMLKVANKTEKITFESTPNQRVVKKIPTFSELPSRRKNSKESIQKQNHRLEDVKKLSLPPGISYEEHLAIRDILLKMNTNKCFQNPIQRLAAKKRRNGHAKTKKDDEIITLLAMILAVIIVQMFMEISDLSPLQEFRNMSLFHNLFTIFVISLIFICYTFCM